MPSSLLSETYYNTKRPLTVVRPIEYPLDGKDDTHFTVRRRYIQNLSAYSRGTKNTADSVYTSAYLVEEPIIDDKELKRIFEQVFATIPATWSDPEGSTYAFPGLEQSTSLGAAKTVTAYTASSGTVTASNDFSDGDFVETNFVWTSGGATFFIRGIHKVSSASGSGCVITPKANGPGSLSSGTIREVVPAREPVTLPCDAKTVYDYYLPGVTSGITTVEDIPMLEPFRVLDAAGLETDTLSATTIPSLSAYLDLVAAKQFICISSFKKRYLGNIHVRVSNFVQAL